MRSISYVLHCLRFLLVDERQPGDAVARRALRLRSAGSPARRGPGRGILLVSHNETSSASVSTVIFDAFRTLGLQPPWFSCATCPPSLCLGRSWRQEPSWSLARRGVRLEDKVSSRRCRDERSTQRVLLLTAQDRGRAISIRDCPTERYKMIESRC